MENTRGEGYDILYVETGNYEDANGEVAEENR